MRLFTLITLLFFSQFSYSQIQESDTYFIEVGDIRALFSENLNLFDVIMADKFIMSKVSPKKLKAIFNYSKHFKNVNLIYRRVFR